VPKPSPYVLLWLDKPEHYELRLHGQLHQSFQRGDDDAFSRWLEAHTAFAFVGQSGRISALKEARSGGAGYWYAYRTHARQTRKRYLGLSANVTFARLEQEAQALSRPSADHPAAAGQAGKRAAASPKNEQRAMLLSLKLSPPRLPGSLVERSRLLGELDMAFSHPLTLVSAAAGSGKTTLLSAWVAALSQGLPGEGAKRSAVPRGAEPACAWLSLDESDNDPIRFWLSVIAALRTCLPTCGEAARELLRSPEAPPLSTILTTLLEEFVKVDREILLILDDYHVISDQAIHDSLLALLDHPPANVHLLLSARTNPALPLSRFRVRSQLLEIRDQDLHFTQQEAARFLVEEMGLPLSEAEVTTLVARTEGWIAGLQLAALALRKRQDLSAAVSDFGGSHRYLLDYVQQEILARLPGRLQDFLLQTSIVTRMNAALCQAITARPTRMECQHMLEELERANLFVVPLDDERQWYRYHDLFREALHARLQASQPEHVPRLHRRAARFYEAQGEWHEAIAHALAAPDYQHAARLVERAAPLCWLSGEAQTVQTWIVALPDAVLWQQAPLALQAMLRLLDSFLPATETAYARAQALVEPTLARLEALLHRHAAGADRPEELRVIERRLRLLRALIETRAILRRGERARLAQLAREVAGLAQEDLSWQMIPLAVGFGLTEGFQHESALLIPRLLQARQQAERAKDLLASIRVREWLAYAYLCTARWPQVEQECLTGLALLEQSGVRSASAGYLQRYLADTYYGWNRLDEAAAALHEMLRSGQDWQQINLLTWGQLSRARLALAHDDLAAADQALHRAEALVQHEPFANLASPVAAFRVQYWLVAGNLEAARHWGEQVACFLDPWARNGKWAALMLVRVQLAQRQSLQALDLLERFREPLNRPGDTLTAMEWLALSVVALHQAGKQEEAQIATARLLALTEPAGAIRLYVDEGEPMKQALSALLAAAGEGVLPSPQEDGKSRDAVSFPRSYVSRLLAAFKQEGQMRAPLVDQSEISCELTAVEGQPDGSEPLSRQELRVFRLLVAGQTYAEIAEALMVSPNTVKTQVSSIYRKLGVSRRAEVIAKASRLHHLSSR
jgi:LuxR family maltose regulon positive regulatory protein